MRFISITPFLPGVTVGTAGAANATGANWPATIAAGTPIRNFLRFICSSNAHLLAGSFVDTAVPCFVQPIGLRRQSQSDAAA